MSLSSYQEIATLYTNSNGSVTVSKAIYIPSNFTVVLKKHICPSLSEANLTIREAINQSRLNHYSICKVYECFLEQLRDTDKFLAVMVVELMETDLSKEIQTRADNARYWSELELLSHLTDLSSACLYAQTNGIAHRDVKPANIFASQGKLKLGDFGSSALRLKSTTHSTLQGTPFYLSPELKRRLISLMTGDQNDFQYDAYQSDVYSLGVTFVYMAFLQPPTWMTNISDLERNTADVLQQLAHMPMLQYALTYMLQVDPNQRVTFTQIFEYCQNTARSVDNLPAIQDYSDVQQAHVQQEGVPEQSSPSSEEGNFKRCLMCQRNVVDTWSEFVEEELEVYSKFFPDLCSKDCLLDMCKREYNPTKCMHDGKLLSKSQKPALMQCNHGFCNTGCLSRFLRQTIPSVPETVSFKCRVCSHPVSEDEIVPFLKCKDALMRLFYTDDRNADKCQKCANPVSKYLQCGHQTCISCLKFSRNQNIICPICGKTDTHKIN